MITRREMLSQSAAVVAGISLVTPVVANSVALPVNEPDIFTKLLAEGYVEKFRDFIWTRVIDSSGLVPYLVYDESGRFQRAYFKAWKSLDDKIWISSGWLERPYIDYDLSSYRFFVHRVFEIPGVKYGEPLKIDHNCRILS